MLIDKRKDLKLTMPQLEKLANLKDSLKAKNDTICAMRLDSMSKSMRGGSYSAGGDNETARSARAVFSADLADVRDDFDAAAQSALALLDDDQKDGRRAARQAAKGHGTARRTTTRRESRRDSRVWRARACRRFAQRIAGTTTIALTNKYKAMAASASF